MFKRLVAFNTKGSFKGVYTNNILESEPHVGNIGRVQNFLIGLAYGSDGLEWACRM